MWHVGAHVSRKKTIVETLKEVQKYGGTALQIFVGNPRSGRLEPSTVKKYLSEAPSVREYLKANNMVLYIHSPYVLNLSSSADYIVSTAVREMQVAAALGAEGIVYHTGKWVTAGSQEAGIARMHEVLESIIQSATNVTNGTKPYVILETSSGQGTELFPDIKDLMQFVKSLSKIQKSRIRFCLDTAHVYAAGYIDFEAALKKLGGDRRIRMVPMVQLNNSKKPLGSRVDRHAGLLDKTAHIPQDSLKAIVRTCKRLGIDVIMETPNESYKSEIPWVLRAV